MGACMPTMGKRPAPPVASSVVLLGRPGAGCTSLLHALAIAAESSGKGGGGGGGGDGGAPPRTGKGYGGKASAATDGSGVTIRRLAVGGQLLDMMDVGELDKMHAVFRKNGLSATAVYVGCTRHTLSHGFLFVVRASSCVLANDLTVSGASLPVLREQRAAASATDPSGAVALVCIFELSSPLLSPPRSIYTLDASSPSTFAAAATDLRRLFIGDRAAKTTIFPDVPLVLAINRIPDGAPRQATGEYVRRLRVDDLPVRALHAVAIDSRAAEHPGVQRALAVLAAEVRRARESSLVS